MYDIIIIGGGVAGFTAALFAARRGLQVLVIAKDVAGQANSTDLIENYPGIPEIGGFELVNNIRQQAEGFGAEFLEAEVSRVSAGGGSAFGGKPKFFVVTAYGRQIKTRAVILAHGKTPRDLGVDGENELKGKGVSYCATCDAPLYKNKIVAVVGVGDMAADAAILLSKFAKKVFVLSKTDKFIAHPALHKSLFKKPNVQLVPFIQIRQITGTTIVSGMELEDLKTGEIYNLTVDGIFVELGYVVDSNLTQNVVKLDDQAQVKVGPDQATSVPGIFAAGDATNRPYKQAAISAGEGANAALACFDWLMRQQGQEGLTSDWTQIKKVK